jgi:20S proteasome subunit beta 3
MSILAYNGGAVIAMGGKNCVAICSDLRLGVQNQTVAKDFQKVSSSSSNSNSTSS